MKKLFILFCCLQIAFGGLWIVKAKEPENRPDAYAYGVNEKEGAWWLQTEDMPDVDDDWYLDTEIPLNYIPVLGEDELYMVINEAGKIEGYRHRTKQEDGSWVWEDVNPDIPESYEAVEGLENIYKVTNEDGSVQYFKYIRNEDDTYCFLEVDENGKELSVDQPDGMTIPENYHRVKGNVYAVVNEHGVITGYMERFLDDKGVYHWQSCDKPEETKSDTESTAPLPSGQQELQENNESENSKESGTGVEITIINPEITQEAIQLLNT